MNFCLKYLYRSVNNCEGLTQCSFVPLVSTLTYTTSNLNNVINYFESNQYIYRYSCNHKNRHPCHDLRQACGGNKSACLVWIRSTDFFYHTQGHVSYSMHTDTINMIHTSQK